MSGPLEIIMRQHRVARRQPRWPGILCGLAWSLALGSLAGVEHFVTNVSQFDAAVAAAQPGDSIVLADRVWTNADLLFKKSGTPTQPITLRAQTPGHVILSGQARLRIAGSWLIVDGLRFENGFYTNGGSPVIQFRETSSVLATNCALLNTAIVNYNPPDLSVDTKWVSIYGLSNRVENCFFQGKSNIGATLVVWLPSSPTNLANYHLIRRNHFGYRPPLGENGGETLRVGDSATSLNISRTIVEENLFRRYNGEIEIVSNKSCENIYRYNTFDSCEGTLTLRHGNRCVVEGNWFLGRGLPLTGGVRIIGEDHVVFNNYLADLTGTGLRSAICFVNGVPDSALNEYFQVKRARVLFNTIVNCVRPFTIGQTVTGGTLPPLDCVAANNLVRAFNAPLVTVVTPPTNFVWQSNVFFGASVGVSDPGIVVTNPLLELAPDGLWRPALHSPVRDAGAGGYTWVVDDGDGQPRDSVPDIGCDEISDAPVLRRPLTVADVGPLWMRTAGPIRSVTVLTHAITLAWDAIPGFRYRPWISSNLNVWSPGPAISATGRSVSWTDDGSLTGGAPVGATARFYRVSLDP